jgi:hypothetical protein
MGHSVPPVFGPRPQQRLGLSAVTDFGLRVRGFQLCLATVKACASDFCHARASEVWPLRPDPRWRVSFPAQAPSPCHGFSFLLVFFVGQLPRPKFFLPILAVHALGGCPAAQICLPVFS